MILKWGVSIGVDAGASQGTYAGVRSRSTRPDVPESRNKSGELSSTLRRSTSESLFNFSLEAMPELKRPKGVNGHLLLKVELDRFWEQFGGRKNDGSEFSQKEKMNALKAMADLVIPYRKQQPRQQRREQFNEIKGTMHKMKRFWKCFACGLPAKERHHIVQLQNGGINSRRNVVSLCPPCHAEIHPWLKR